MNENSRDGIVITITISCNEITRRLQTNKAIPIFFDTTANFKTEVNSIIRKITHKQINIKNDYHVQYKMFRD